MHSSVGSHGVWRGGKERYFVSLSVHFLNFYAVGRFISLLPVSKIRKNAMLVSRWSPGSTAGLCVWCVWLILQTNSWTENVDVCFLHWILAVCNVYWIFKLCIDQFVFTTLVTVIWFWKKQLCFFLAFLTLTLNYTFLASYPLPLAYSRSAQQSLSSVTCSVYEPRATCFTVHFRSQIPKKYVYLSWEHHINTYMQHLCK